MRKIIPKTKEEGERLVTEGPWIRIYSTKWLNDDYITLYKFLYKGCKKVKISKDKWMYIEQPKGGICKAHVKHQSVWAYFYKEKNTLIQIACFKITGQMGYSNMDVFINKDDKNLSKKILTKLFGKNFKLLKEKE